MPAPGFELEMRKTSRRADFQCGAGEWKKLSFASTGSRPSPPRARLRSRADDLSNGGVDADPCIGLLLADLFFFCCLCRTGRWLLDIFSLIYSLAETGLHRLFIGWCFIFARFFYRVFTEFWSKFDLVVAELILTLLDLISRILTHLLFDLYRVT